MKLVNRPVKPEELPCPECGAPFLREQRRDGTWVERCFGCTIAATRKAMGLVP
jgi:hypothetical protein